MENKMPARYGERGEGGFKIVLFLAAVFLGGFAAFQYVPVTYNAASFKQEMQTIVDQSAFVPAARDGGPAWVQRKIQESAPKFDVPQEADIKVQREGDATLTATVKYTQKVSLLPFGLYVYPYEFSHTARTATLLTK
jgi:hypothetical protein